LVLSVFGLELLPHADAKMTIRPAAKTIRENLPIQTPFSTRRNPAPNLG